MNVALPSSVVSDVSLGKSIHHFISFDSLRMINSLELSSSASYAHRQHGSDASLGESIHHSYPFYSLSLKHIIAFISSKVNVAEPS